MNEIFSPSICHINLAALARNYQKLAQKGPLMPVIKADAYGHGLAPAAEALSKAGAEWFAVGCAAEGLKLREHYLKQDILLLLGCLDAEDWGLALQHNLTPLVGNWTDLKIAAQMAGKAGAAGLKIAIKCDTGMSRLGFSLEDVPALTDFFLSAPGLRPELLVSHLACADMADQEEFTSQQLQLFHSFLRQLKNYFPGLKASLGNSAAALGKPDAVFDYFRTGLALYGGNPFSGTELAHCGQGLEWVMSFSAPILHIRELKRGQTVSYGRTFTASRPMTIAVAACGYATGIPRLLSNNLHFIVNGQKAPQIGRICMSMLMLDISQIPDAQPGALAWLLACPDKHGEPCLDAQELAARLGTIPYEILCGIGGLNQRKYYD